MERIVNLDGSAAVISSFDYDFDGVGNRTSGTDQNGEFSNWTYDCTNQLDGDSLFTGWGWARFTLLQWKRYGVNQWATFPVDAQATFNYGYVYDPAGNRLRQAELDAVWIVTNTYDNANRRAVQKPCPQADGQVELLFDKLEQQSDPRPAGVGRRRKHVAGRVDRGMTAGGARRDPDTSWSV